MTASAHTPRIGWANLARGLCDLLLPAACVVCRRPHVMGADGMVCGTCMARLVPLTMPLCHRCGHPRLRLGALSTAEDGALPSEAPLAACTWCPRLHSAVRAVRSVARMDTGTGPDLVHALKYRGWHAASLPMARRMARLDWPADVRTERAAIVPIPLSEARRRERGYNQAECLAHALAPAWSIPVWPDVLVRARHTVSQVRLTPSQRASNVSGAFAVPMHRRARLRGRHLVLVDDVITTAATLNAAVQALLEGGARIISCATFGRAPDPGDRATSDPDFIRN